MMSIKGMEKLSILMVNCMKDYSVKVSFMAKECLFILIMGVNMQGLSLKVSMKAKESMYGHQVKSILANG